MMALCGGRVFMPEFLGRFSSTAPNFVQELMKKLLIINSQKNSVWKRQQTRKQVISPSVRFENRYCVK
jgi:hypothetical protein